MIAKGLNASPGAAVGKVYFTADDAEARHEAGEHVILVRPETSPDDLHGMIAAEGILTSRGGLVSPRGGRRARHGQARDLRRRTSSKIDLARRQFDGRRRRPCARATSSRSTAPPARSSSARCRSSRPSRRGPFGTILGWADELPRAEGAHQRRPARGRASGARVRRRGHRPVPHRAHVPRRPPADRAAHDPRRHARTRRTPRSRSSRAQQETDFDGILEAMDGLPVTVRLLDPPLHEFLPDHEELLVKQAQGRARPTESRSCSHAARVLARVEPDARHAWVPARHPQARPLPHAGARRSCRPRSRRKQAGGDPIVEIMIPLIVSEPELALLERLGARGGRRRCSPTPSVERRLPRRHDDRDAARRARRRRDRRGRRVLLVRHQRPHADDVRVLAATTSRAASCPSTSSTSCCRRTRSRRSTSKASASSCAWACEQGRATRPDIKLGICGEHGGDPGVGRVLPRGRPRLRVVLAVPRADRPPRRRARRARHDGPGATA